MELVLERHGHVVTHLHGVVTGPLATGLAAATRGGAHVGAGSAEVEPDVGELLENILKHFGPAAEQHHITGGAVEVGNAGPVLLPNVAYFANRIRGIEPSRRLVDTNRMEMLDLRELLRQIVVSTDNAAAVSHDADDATVFPVADFLVVGSLEHPQEVVGGFAAFFHTLVDFFDEARPRAFFELI